MMFDHPTGMTPWHPMGCLCDACEPDSPADTSEGPIVNTIGLIFLGAVAGVPIAAVIDVFTTHVGLLSVFGS